MSMNGDKAYARGQEAARKFLASGPSWEKRKEHWAHADCARDDYDRGYREVLKAAPRV